jgi:hypothetical protein
MKWFRSNLRLGSRLALGALAVQFLLSFGHFHAGNAHTVSAPAHAHQAIGLAAAFLVGSEQTSRSVASGPVRSRISFGHEPAGQPDDDCAICAVMALANTMLDVAPPDLLAPQAAAFAFLADEAGFADLNSAVGAFQPRGPPIA